jgi:hypothetical protein
MLKSRWDMLLLNQRDAGCIFEWRPGVIGFLVIPKQAP